MQYKLVEFRVPCSVHKASYEKKIYVVWHNKYIYSLVWSLKAQLKTKHIGQVKLFFALCFCQGDFTSPEVTRKEKKWSSQREEILASQRFSLFLTLLCKFCFITVGEIMLMNTYITPNDYSKWRTCMLMQNLNYPLYQSRTFTCSKLSTVVGCGRPASGGTGYVCVIFITLDEY